MRQKTIARITIFAALTLASFSCTPDLPPVMKAVPAGTDVLGSIDAKVTLGYIKTTLPKIVPPELKDKIPSFTVLAKQAMMLAGLDIEKLTTLHFFGDMEAKTWTFVAEGLSAKGIKGKTSGKYKGTDIYKVMGGPVYSELKDLGLIVAINEAELKKVIDTFHGDSKRLADTDKGKLVQDMLKIHKNMKLVRLYVLTGRLPQIPMIGSMKIDGGGIFIDLDKGAALSVLTDKTGADKIAQAVGLGLMAAQTGLMMGGTKGMPVAVDADAKKVFTEFLGKVKTAKQQSGLTISFQGDLKPLIEKTMAIAAGAFASRPIPMPAVSPAPALTPTLADNRPKDLPKEDPKPIMKKATGKKTIEKSPSRVQPSASK